MDDKKIFERDMQTYEIAGLFSGLSQEISMMGFDVSGDMQFLTDKINRWEHMLGLIKTKIEEIEINEILND